jgi:LDH2 family malate/lactate/ureidoglycolate dehydrogenase
MIDSLQGNTGTSNDDRVWVPERKLRTGCEAILRALGVSEEDAAVTADVFIQAELMGEESHGTRLLLHVLGRLKAGGDNARTNVDVVMDRGAVAVWNANRSLGQVVAARAMRLAIDKARKFGIGFVTVRNSNSYTSAKYYPLLAVEAGMLGITYTNTSRQLMPPPGGRAPVLGNNPTAIAAPAGKFPPFVLDMACTRAAVEKILQARERNEPIPEDWALDAEGNSTVDPEKALASMALLPFGGYKAFGMGIAHEILTSVISGGALFAGDSKGFLPYDGAMHTSHSFQAINIEWFMPLDEFRARMDEVIRAIKSAPLRPGAERIRIPGERSAAELQRRIKEGIPLRQTVVTELQRWAEELGVSPL